MSFPQKASNTIRFRRRVFQIERLVVMPAVIRQVFNTLANEHISPSELAAQIERDPALVSKVLRFANMDYFGLPGRVTTIEQAIQMVGFIELEILVLGAGLSDKSARQKASNGIDIDGLWRHSLAVSWVAKELAEAANYASPREVMLAGLLHDLGKLIMCTHFIDEFTSILGLVERGVPYYKAEEACGLKHTTLGDWLARRWRLPGIYAEAIRNHHQPLPDNPHFSSTCLVFLADNLVKNLDYGLVHEAAPIQQEMALAATDLTDAHLGAVARKAEKQVPALLGI